MDVPESFTNNFASHKALIGYLLSINASGCVDVLREELNLKDTFSDEAVKKYARILEQKWASTALLHRKVKHIELAAR
jgi:hypothetical protein